MVFSIDLQIYIYIYIQIRIILILFFYYYILLMMPKIVSKSHSLDVLKTIHAQYRTVRPQESTGVIPANDPLKIKLEIFSQLQCAKTGVNYAYLVFLRALGFYSSVEPTSVSCVGRCFLTRKIIINVRILRDP